MIYSTQRFEQGDDSNISNTVIRSEYDNDWVMMWRPTMIHSIWLAGRDVKWLNMREAFLVGLPWRREYERLGGRHIMRRERTRACVQYARRHGDEDYLVNVFLTAVL